MKAYTETQPDRETINALKGPAVLDFGTNWCGHCKAAAPLIAQVLGEATTLQHIKVEDGPGRPLGRSFRVKLWPTLIFLQDGEERARVVRPTDTEAISAALKSISA